MKRQKNLKGTLPKTSPLKTYKKQVKRMKNRLKDLAVGPEFNSELTTKYETRLQNAELFLKEYEQKQAEKVVVKKK